MEQDQAGAAAGCRLGVGINEQSRSDAAKLTEPRPMLPEDRAQKPWQNEDILPVRHGREKVAGVGNPIRLSATPVQYRCAAPKLGEHTSAVIKDWFGAGSDEIEQLRTAGALGCKGDKNMTIERLSRSAPMRVIALIEDPVMVRAILTHIGRPAGRRRLARDQFLTRAQAGASAWACVINCIGPAGSLSPRGRTRDAKHGRQSGDH